MVIRKRLAMLLAAGLVATATACSAGSRDASEQGTVYEDNAQLVSAGVARVTWAQLSLADLTIRRMTAIDVLEPPLPRCVTDQVGKQPAYFDLNWTSVPNYTALPEVALSLQTPQGSPLIAEFPDGSCKPVDGMSLGALPSGNREQLVLQLFARQSGPLRSLRVGIAGRQARLPLIRSCGDRPQPPSLKCAVDPVSYEAGSPWSVNLIA